MERYKELANENFVNFIKNCLKYVLLLPGSIKTVEGTLFGVLSQIFFVQALIYFNLLQISTQAFVKCLIAISVTSIVEAKTDQIDNIVLPLTMYILIMM